MVSSIIIMTPDKLSNYAPTLFSFEPDDSCLTYLHATVNENARQLWAVDSRTLRCVSRHLVTGWVRH